MLLLPSTNRRRVDVMSEQFAEARKLEEAIRSNLKELGYVP
jgi:hypothetical protein